MSKIGDFFFGLDTDINNMIERAINSLNKLNSLDASSVMKELYEIEYGIHNHFNSKNPISSVAFNECEDINNGSHLEEIMNNYILKNIKSLFGIDFINFLELPKDIIEMMFNVAEREIVRKHQAVNELESELKK